MMTSRERVPTSHRPDGDTTRLEVHITRFFFVRDKEYNVLTGGEPSKQLSFVKYKRCYSLLISSKE